MRVHNLYKPLPFNDGSVACIYAGQLWEHFRPEDAVRLTRECLRVLAPGGVLRVSVPDGVEFCRQYLALYEHEARQLPQARSPERLRRHVELFFKDIATRRIWLGSIGHTHKWLYDEVQLVSLLQACGFPLVERMRFHHSRIPTVGAVELSDCLIVEGVKGRASASMAA
jgi:predicted SAM-dependent methyltransferase